MLYYLTQEKKKGGNTMKHYIAMWTNILNLSGRTTRAGYWVPYLVNILVGALIAWLLPAAYGIYDIVLTVAMFTLLARRMRDAGFSWILAVLSFAGLLPFPFSLLRAIPVILALFPSKK